MLLLNGQSVRDEERRTNGLGETGPTVCTKNTTKIKAQSVVLWLRRNVELLRRKKKVAKKWQKSGKKKVD